MITLRPANERGHANHGWLDSHFTFSFSQYHDPNHMGFADLRVINDDIIAPEGGFDTHGHRDMEIITYVLEGALAHKDSLGNGSTILPGDVQRMSAGKGIMHSEFNPSENNHVHLLQIWILPDKRNVDPSYEQRNFSIEERTGSFRLVASQDGRDGSVSMNQDANMYATILNKGMQTDYRLNPGRVAWVHLAKGSATLNGKPLKAGDGAAITDESKLSFGTDDSAEILLFDMKK